jgi:hypothetical protein
VGLCFSSIERSRLELGMPSTLGAATERLRRQRRRSVG